MTQLIEKNTNNTRKVFFTSDTHYYHKNIAGPAVSQWKEGYRNFSDEKEMSDCLVDCINKTVGENDILYHLGDWSFGGIQNVLNFRKRINCKEIHLILGNHDQHIKSNRIDERENLCLKDLFSSVKDTDWIDVNGQNIFLSHYKHFIWLGSHKGFWHLYGHSHSSAEHNIIGKSMDVGVDNAYKLLGEYKPFSFEQIKEMMDARDIHYPDHHNSETNLK